MCGKLLAEAAVTELKQLLPDAQMHIRWLARTYQPQE
ncbi:MAG: hypothetical protein M3Z51_06145 [Snodgrassella alvi]|nr:hypothetical protein [Snodgrassella alvi]